MPDATTGADRFAAPAASTVAAEPLTLDLPLPARTAPSARDVLRVALTLGLALPWVTGRWRRALWAATALHGRAFAHDGGVAAAAVQAAALPVLTGLVAVAGSLSVRAGTAALAAGLLLHPWLQHAAAHHHVAHTLWDGRRLRMAAPRRRFYALALRGWVLALLLALLLAGALAGLGSLLGWRAGGGGPARDALAAGLAALLALLAWALVWRPVQHAARWNLTWDGAAADGLRLRSRLRARTLLALAPRQLLRTVATLGLGAPRAVVAGAAARVQAMTAHGPAVAGAGTTVAAPAGGPAGAGAGMARQLL